MRGSTFTQRRAAFVRAVLRRPARLLALLAIVVAGASFDRLVLPPGEAPWGVLAAMGVSG